MPAAFHANNVRHVVSAGSVPPTHRSDAELLAAHVAGDRYAFEELFRRHHRRLRRLARINCRSPEDAEDVLQDAMLAAHRHAAAFRHHAAVGSWLHRIVVNACQDKLRHNRTHGRLILETVSQPVADRTGQLDTAITLRGALMQLSEVHREVLLTVDMHGYSIAEASLLLGIPEGTVKSRCARARTRLAALIRRGDEGMPGTGTAIVTELPAGAPMCRAG